MHTDPKNFDRLAKLANGLHLPQSWNPRREQPAWDRYFEGNADAASHFGHKTTRAVLWLAEATEFSAIVLKSYPTEQLAQVGERARNLALWDQDQQLDGYKSATDNFYDQEADPS